MSNLSSYQELNLREGASINEIKAAFRTLAKRHHPDADGRDAADVDKFIKAQTAYQKLMKRALAHNQARRAKAAQAAQGDRTTQTAQTAKVAPNWRFQGRREVGLDVFFSLSILRPDSGGCKVVLPWQAQEACPRCLGQGQTLSRIGSNSLYRPCACTKCGGRGVITRDSQLEVDLKPEMIGQEKIRLRKAGLYNAKSALRGDLTLEIQWVSRTDAWSAAN